MAIQSYKTKKGKMYRAAFDLFGERHSQRGFKTITKAKDWITDERRRLKDKANQPEKTRFTFSALSDEYITDCKGRMALNTGRSCR